MTKATPIENAYDGCVVQSQDGARWLIFRYNDEDKDPWKWAKFFECDGRVYRWMSWNSDNNTINYKECRREEIAKPVRGKKRA